MNSKKDLREWAKWDREQRKQADKIKIDKSVYERLQTMPEWQKAQRVFIYVSVKQEIDTCMALEWLLARGKQVYVPRCKPGGVMEAVEIRSISELQPAPFGLLEPPVHITAVEPGKLDFVVVPCLLCDKEGYRVGYGGGYYDRYLPQTGAVTVCLCEENHLIENVPRERYDIPVEWAVTESRVIQCKKTPADGAEGNS